jgi:integrase
MSRQPTMAQHARAYLKHRRTLGFELRWGEHLVVRFAEFTDRSGCRGPLTTDLILRWVHLPKTAAKSYTKRRLSAVRGFARYLNARDARNEVPDSRLVPKPLRPQPHFYDEHQLGQLLTAAGRMKSTYDLRPLTYQTLFGLLASTGLRISEALKLTRGQIDLERGILRVEHTKFKKSRLVPLHPTARRALRRYAAARDSQWGSHGERAFFVDGHGLALKYPTVIAAFRRLCRDLGWHRGNGEWPRPRIHDLRHSFACRCLLRWYRDGEDVHHRIVSLSTYLGHSNATSTYWYLTAVPELLAVAGNRFERFVSVAGRSSS